MTNPFLFVGVGGSGGKTLRAIKAELTRILRSSSEGEDFWRKNGFPKVWQFLSIDTPYKQDGQDFNAKMLDAKEYLGLVQPNIELQVFLKALENRKLPAQVQEELMQQFPLKGEYKRSIDLGAGQYRSIGRTVVLDKLEEIKKRVELAVDNMTGSGSDAEMTQLARIFKQQPSGGVRPQIMLVSSIAGGSGAGQFLDVAEAIKAAIRQPWTNNISAILFAPDVFEDPKITVRDGIAPNSYAAMNELVNSMFRTALPKSLKTFYNSASFGEGVDGDDAYNVGPKYVYMVGRSNDKVSFSSQNEVYHSVAVSLAKWATDSIIIEQIENYIKQNAQFGSTDNLNLRHSNEASLSMPINSMGFARVTLGMDMFADYCAGRIAKSAVNTLVNGHKVNMKEDETDLAAVDRKVKELIGTFKDEFKFGRKSLIAAIHAQSDIAKWSQDIQDEFRMKFNANKKEQDAISWTDQLMTEYKKLFPVFEDRWISQRKVVDGVKKLQTDSVHVALRFVADYGLLVTEGLIKAFAAGLKDDLSQQDSSSQSAIGLYNKAASSITDLFKKGAGAKPFTSQSSYMSGAIKELDEMGRTHLSASDSELASEILKEGIENFLVPLSRELARSHEELRGDIKDSNYKNRGVNLFASWPEEHSMGPSHAENIKSLIPISEFDSDFKKYLGRSVQAEGNQAIQKARRELICGSDQIEEMQSKDKTKANSVKQLWHPFGINQSGNPEMNHWIPKGFGEPQAKWSASFSKELDEWEDMAENYIRIEGRPLEKRLKLSLYDWLRDPDHQSENENQFEAMLGEALDHGKPFAEVNKNILNFTHGMTQMKMDPIISKIPVEFDSRPGTFGARISNVLTNAGIAESSIASKFAGQDSTSTIDIFTTFSGSVHHIVFDNFMKPVYEQWGKVKRDLDKRNDFNKWRRTRPLTEAIPLSPLRIDQTIRGWIVADLLDFIKSNPPEMGATPMLSVYDDTLGVDAHVSFPYPLMYWGNSVPKHDWLAAVLASCGIALVLCADAKSEAPFAPYLVLQNLGGDPASVHAKDLTLPIQLLNWINHGVINTRNQDLQPLASKAGDRHMSPLQRIQAICSYLEEQKLGYEKDIVAIDKALHPELSWQIREEYLRALDDLIRVVRNSQS